MIHDPTVNCERFYTDRWLGSRAFLLPLEQRGLYRELLTAAWRRGAELPTDEATLRRLIIVTDDEWRRTWSVIARYWQERGGHLVNPNQQEIFRETQERSSRASQHGRAAARRRWLGR